MIDEEDIPSNQKHDEARGPNERKYTSTFYIYGCYVCLGNTLQGFTYPYQTKGLTLLKMCAKCNTNVKNIYYSKSKCVINEDVGKPTKKK
jgi:hypothetical protein